VDVTKVAPAESTVSVTAFVVTKPWGFVTMHRNWVPLSANTGIAGVYEGVVAPAIFVKLPPTGIDCH